MAYLRHVKFGDGFDDAFGNDAHHLRVRVPPSRGAVYAFPPDSGGYRAFPPAGYPREEASASASASGGGYASLFPASSYLPPSYPGRDPRALPRDAPELRWLFDRPAGPGPGAPALVAVPPPPRARGGDDDAGVAPPPGREEAFDAFRRTDVPPPPATEARPQPRYDEHERPPSPFL